MGRFATAFAAFGHIAIALGLGLSAGPACGPFGGDSPLGGHKNIPGQTLEEIICDAAAQQDRSLLMPRDRVYTVDKEEMCSENFSGKVNVIEATVEAYFEDGSVKITRDNGDSSVVAATTLVESYERFGGFTVGETVLYAEGEIGTIKAFIYYYALIANDDGEGWVNVNELVQQIR